MAATVISGIGGAVGSANTVRTWEISYKADVQKYVASNTEAGTGRLAGNKDWSGSFTAYGDTPALLPGASTTFTGTIDGTTGATGTIIIDSVDIKIDIEKGGIIENTVTFSGNSDLTLGAAAASDTTVPNPPTSIGCKLALGTVVTSPVWTDVADVRTIDIKLTTANNQYVSSSTSGGVRRMAGNLDCTLSYTVYPGVDTSAHTLTITAPNTVRGIRAYVSATTFWEFLWMIFGDATGLKVDRESAAIVGCTQNTEMAGFQSVDGTTPTVGSIKTPAAATIWPV